MLGRSTSTRWSRALTTGLPVALLSVATAAGLAAVALAGNASVPGLECPPPTSTTSTTSTSTSTATSTSTVTADVDRARAAVPGQTSATLTGEPTVTSTGTAPPTTTPPPTSTPTLTPTSTPTLTCGPTITATTSTPSGSTTTTTVPPTSTSTTPPTTTTTTTTTTAPPSGPACYEPPVTPPSSGNGASIVQDQIADVAGRILALVDANGYPGFTSVIADPDRQGLFLCWLDGDPLPAEIAAIVASPGQPVTVTRMDTPYSRAYLDARVDSILGNVSLGSQIGGVIHEVTVPEEGTGLVAGVLPFNPNVDPGQFAAQAAPILSAAAGVPVTVRVRQPAVPLVGTRRNDASPWYGGARLLNYTFNPPGHCSSGFGVTAGGVDYLLTAAHCFGFGLFEDVYNGAAPPNHVKIGRVQNVADRSLALDAERVKITNGLAGTRIYQGGVGANESTDPVVGVRRNVVNLFVVTSGAMSGSHGLIKIVDVRVMRDEVIARVHFKVGPHVKASALAIGQAQPVAAARGDSGGPVVMPEALNTNVHAVGTISAAASPFFACRVFDGRECASDIFYPDITDVLKKFGSTLK